MTDVDVGLSADLSKSIKAGNMRLGSCALMSDGRFKCPGRRDACEGHAFDDGRHACALAPISLKMSDWNASSCTGHLLAANHGALEIRLEEVLKKPLAK